MQYLEAIPETSYLSAQNSPQYRKIMRIFYREYEKMHYQLSKEDVLLQMRLEPRFEDYSADQLGRDLDMLFEWKNLTRLQDPRKTYKTIAEYKNKQFRYTMSEYAVEIERLTVRLENLFLEPGNLSSNLFVRIAENLRLAEQLQEVDEKNVLEWWENLQEDFKRLNRNYQDYLREFYSGSGEQLLKSVEFVLHKDRFISYLREFIQQMQQYSSEIAAILSQNSETIEVVLLPWAIHSELEIPHTRSEKLENREEIIRDKVWGQWRSLKNWFLPHDGEESESNRVLAITNDVIRGIIQNAALIVQTQNWGISRKDDYLKFIELFQNCKDLEEAHRLSAHVFGVQHIQHFKGDPQRESDSISESVYGEAPIEYQLKPHTRSYRPKKDKQGFPNKSLEKMIQRQEYLENTEKERQLMMRYINNGKLEVAAIYETVPESVRTMLLRWISQANMNSGKTGHTEFGQKFRLVRNRNLCVLHCEDGDLVMPAYILEFSE